LFDLVGTLWPPWEQQNGTGEVAWPADLYTKFSKSSWGSLAFGADGRKSERKKERMKKSEREIKKERDRLEAEWTTTVDGGEEEEERGRDGGRERRGERGRRTARVIER